MTTYDVFLSHASDNKPTVETLARRLREDGLKPFLDIWHLVPGEPWQKALEDALETSRTCAVFVGAELGPWQNEEMRDALAERTRDADFRVIPVLLPDALMPGKRGLPRPLRRLTWVDFTAGLDDDDAYYRLICGIRGVQPDAGSTPATPTTPAAPGGSKVVRQRRRYGFLIAVLVVVLSLGLEWRRGEPTDSLYRIQVTVLDSQGRPTAEAKLSSDLGGDITGADGRFVIELPAARKPANGQLTIRASHEAAFLVGSGTVTLGEHCRSSLVLRRHNLCRLTYEDFAKDRLSSRCLTRCQLLQRFCDPGWCIGLVAAACEVLNDLGKCLDLVMILGFPGSGLRRARLDQFVDDRGDLRLLAAGLQNDANEVVGLVLERRYDSPTCIRAS